MLGVLIGIFFPIIGVTLKSLGDAFVRLIKMMIGPVIFCTIISGIASIQDTKKVGRVGIKAIVYFEIFSTIALIIGLIIINVLKPGVGMNIDSTTLKTDKVNQYIEQVNNHDNLNFFMNIIPDNIVNALAKGDLLQILFFSILFGIALSKIGDAGKPIVQLIKSTEKGLFAVIKIIMYVAPLGAFGAMSFTVGKYGFGSIIQLGSLMISFYITCFIFIVFVLGGVLKYFGFSLFKLVRYLRDELFIVLGTASSEAALPNLITKLENAGCSQSVVGLVVPTGYSFNLDGTSIYLTMAAVFLAQATNTPMGLSEQISLLLVLLITSKGAAGVVGSGFITLAAVLPITGSIPVGAIALILGIDRFMAEGRSITNFIGNAVAGIVVSKWENEIDMNKAQKHLF
jgi:aerobic C4-dicarboxylate transport protein